MSKLEELIKELCPDGVEYDKLVPIPYPNDIDKSLSEQQRIVDILDRFDTLCNDIQAVCLLRSRQDSNNMNTTVISCLPFQKLK